MAEDFDACIVYQIHGSKVRMSIRSKNETARKIAEAFGGGGHDNSAGCCISLEKFVEILNTKTIKLESARINF